VDDARPVNARIRELIGLDHDAFLKAVVLPQGRFQELLETSAAERAPALKSILGLDQISEVRTQAIELYDRLQPPLTELETKRTKLLDDPQAAIEDAERRIATANKRRAQLERLEQSIKEARLAHDAAAQRAKQCRAAEEQLLTLTADDLEGQYRQLLTTDDGLERQISEVNRQLAEHVANHATLDELLVTADAKGTGVSGTAMAIATLSTLRNELSEVQHAEEELSAEQSSIEDQAADLEARKATQAMGIREAKEAEAAAKEAIDAHRATVAQFDQARSLLEWHNRRPSRRTRQHRPSRR
jgi:exonuclease SbcC